jgi:hypothetical protein
MYGATRTRQVERIHRNAGRSSMYVNSVAITKITPTVIATAASGATPRCSMRWMSANPMD